MLSFPSKVNHLGSMDLNLVYQIVHFPRIQALRTDVTSESLFLRRILQGSFSFGIHYGESESQLTNVQTLYVVLVPNVKNVYWLIHAGP